MIYMTPLFKFVFGSASKAYWSDKTDDTKAKEASILTFGIGSLQMLSS